jgi:mediator of RNA polymerase II transcription subunit 17
MALNLVSLLLAKDKTSPALNTCDPFLKDLDLAGTLGMLKIDVAQLPAVQQQDNKKIARGWKIQNLNKSVDSILASATRLEKEIEVETKYWQQVLAISEKGWAVCKVPGDRHILAVTFGFSESATAFKNRGLAALHRDEDGNITLQGPMAREPRAIRVRIRSNNEETGSSPVPLAISDDAPIESHILQSRNTLYFEELWQEINREARSLGPFGVRSKEGTIICPLSPNKSLVLDLITLVDDGMTLSLPDDLIAQGIHLALQLLLSYAHRHNLRQRTKTASVLSMKKRADRPYPLLRPILTRISYQNYIASIHNLLKPFCAVLQSAGLNPSYNIISRTQGPQNLSRAENTIRLLVDQLETKSTFQVTPQVTINVASQTKMFPIAGTNYRIWLMPEDCPLVQTCKPLPSSDSWATVEDYVLFAVSCAIASHFTVSSDTDNTDGWQATVQPYVLRKRFSTVGRNKQLAFIVQKVEAKGNREEHLKVIANWEWLGEGPQLKGEGSYEWIQKIGGESDSKWGSGEGEVIRTLAEIVEQAGRDQD